jgi:hypothetical protein
MAQRSSGKIDAPLIAAHNSQSIYQLLGNKQAWFLTHISRAQNLSG